jgi:hypothetical protein
MATPVVEANAGSFRDREGRVYHFGSRIFRGLSQPALQNYLQLVDQPFFQTFLESGQIVGTRLLTDEENPLPVPVKSQWEGFLEHQRIPQVSYPY